jgi:hypothetical protein
MELAVARDDETVHNTLNSGAGGGHNVYRKGAGGHAVEGTRRPSGADGDGDGDECTGLERSSGQSLAAHIREAVRIAQHAREQLLSRSGRAIASAALDTSSESDDDGSVTMAESDADPLVRVGHAEETPDRASEIAPRRSRAQWGKGVAAWGAPPGCSGDSSYELSFDDQDAADFPLLSLQTGIEPPLDDGGPADDGDDAASTEVQRDMVAGVVHLPRSEAAVVHRHGELVMRTAIEPMVSLDERRRSAAALAMRRKLFAEAERDDARAYAMKRQHGAGTAKLRAQKEAIRKAEEAQYHTVAQEDVHEWPPLSDAEVIRVLTAEQDRDDAEQAEIALEQERYTRALRYHRRVRTQSNLKSRQRHSTASYM